MEQEYNEFVTAMVVVLQKASKRLGINKTENSVFRQYFDIRPFQISAAVGGTVSHCLGYYTRFAIPPSIMHEWESTNTATVL